MQFYIELKNVTLYVCVCVNGKPGVDCSLFSQVESFDGYGSSQMEERLKEAKKI